MNGRGACFINAFVTLSFPTPRSLMTVGLLCLGLVPAHGQYPNKPMEHTSSLGMKFTSVTGTPVLFATVETRLSEWDAFVREKGYEWSYKPPFEQAPDHPVVGVTLEDARAFCLWLTDKDRAENRLNSAQSYRLPTKAEWDAAIGLMRTRKPDLTVDEKVRDEQVYPWGTAWPPPEGTANFANDEIPGYNDPFPYTAPVGHFKPTAEGLYDLAGNVWEWCWDPDIRAEQVAVLRGGSWAYFRPECLRSAYQYAVPADMRMPTVGFRCVMEDRQRSSIMIAEAETLKSQIRAQRREEILGSDVAKEDLAAMKARLTANGSPSQSVSQPSRDLKPAVPGEIFQSSIGLTFSPVQGPAILFGQTEVRVADVESWLKATGGIWDKKPPFATGPDHPATGVTWSDAQAFAQWLTAVDQDRKLLPAGAAYRLPSDLEWSAAAGLENETGSTPEERGRNAQMHFPWAADGTFPPRSGTVNLDALGIEGYRDSQAYTSPVTGEEANAQGIHGLGGNAAEWCQDPWPGSPDERVIRGGSWLVRDKEQLKTGYRQHLPKNAANSGVGFRLVLDFASTPQ